MIRLLLKKFKKVLTLLIIGVMLSSFGYNECYGELTMGEGTSPQIVVRPGEYGNENSVKAGKRMYIDIETYNKIKDDIRVRKDDKDRLFVSEFDINVKLATRIAQKLSQKGVKVDLQISTSKSQDLNAAGRWSAKKHPDIYFSCHHNAYKPDSSGYLFIVNNKDKVSEKVAKQLSESIVDNPMNIPQLKNRYNERDGKAYIGEMNEMGKTNSINILGEMGFFSNQEELVKIVNNEQIEFLADKISNELINTLDILQRR